VIFIEAGNPGFSYYLTAHLNILNYPNEQASETATDETESQGAERRSRAVGQIWFSGSAVETACAN